MKHSLKATPLLWLALAAPASAAILPGVAVDGPSNLIDTARPDIDVAPDNSAALVYLKNNGGVNHPFVSRFTGGTWGAPQRVDTGSGNAASNPRIAIANGGKVVVSYISGGNAVVRISSAPGSGFGAEHIVQAGGSKADVDLSPNGNGYVVAESSNDVFAERLEGDTWTDVGTGALDSDQTNEAGGSNRDVRIAASLDGTGGVMAWGEVLAGVGDGEDVFVRRLTGATPGNALGTRLPAGSLPNSGAASGKTADQPAVDMDGTGTIWVVYRQNFEYGAFTRHRAIARPITGATVGAGQLVDNMGDAPTEGRDFQQVDVNGAGLGLLSHHGNLSSGLEWASLAGGTWTKGGLVNLSDNSSVPGGIPALGENGSGLIAYAFKAGTGANTAKVRPTFGGLGAEIELSNPAFGDLLGALDASVGSGTYAAATFVQQVAADATTRRLVAAVVDLPQPPVVNPPPPPPDTTDPDVTGLALSRTRFRLGSALPSVAAVKTGTVIRFTISEAATVRLRFKRALPGRRVGGKCRKPTRLNRSRRRCTRMLSVRGSVSLAVQPGKRRIKFAGRLSARRRLRPGRYQLILRATDAAGNVSTPDRARFRLLRAKR